MLNEAILVFFLKVLKLLSTGCLKLTGSSDFDKFNCVFKLLTLLCGLDVANGFLELSSFVSVIAESVFASTELSKSESLSNPNGGNKIP